METNKKIYEIRKKRGLSQGYVAKKIGMSQTNFSKLERGEVRIFLDDFLKICSVLSVNPSDILEEDGGENSIVLTPEEIRALHIVVGILNKIQK